MEGRGEVVLPLSEFCELTDEQQHVVPTITPSTVEEYNDDEQESTSTTNKNQFKFSNAQNEASEILFCQKNHSEMTRRKLMIPDD